MYSDEWRLLEHNVAKRVLQRGLQNLKVPAQLGIGHTVNMIEAPASKGRPGREISSPLTPMLGVWPVSYVCCSDLICQKWAVRSPRFPSLPQAHNSHLAPFHSQRVGENAPFLLTSTICMSLFMKTLQ